MPFYQVQAAYPMLHSVSRQCMPTSRCQVALLQSIEEISDSVKSRTLLSALQALADDAISKELCNAFGPRFEEYCALVISR